VVVDCVEISGPVERVSVKVAFVAACVKTSVSASYSSCRNNDM
jgi:hypothetical protein